MIKKPKKEEGKEASEERQNEGAMAGQPKLNFFEEEQQHDYYDEIVLEQMEQHAGSALDTAQQYLEDFQRQKFEILPRVMGILLA